MEGELKQVDSPATGIIGAWRSRFREVRRSKPYWMAAQSRFPSTPGWPDRFHDRHTVAGGADDSRDASSGAVLALLSVYSN